MGALPPEERDRWCSDLLLVQTEVETGVVAGTARSQCNIWLTWLECCASISFDPWLQSIRDPVPILQVFAHRVRTGELSLSGSVALSRSPEAYIRAIGQTFARLGAPDPRLNTFGDIDFRLSRQYSSYRKADPPPTWVKPILLSLLHHVFQWATVQNVNHCQQRTMILPSSSYSVPENIVFPVLMPFIHSDYAMWGSALQLIDWTFLLQMKPPLWAATSCSLTFSTQKNGTRGEIVGHAQSMALHACPVTTLIRLVLRLRLDQAPPYMPLCSVYLQQKWMLIITSAQITTGLRLQVVIHGLQFGLIPADVSARSLRASGAMALLLGGIDADRIKLVGRWKTDEMLRYLHAQAEPVMHQFSQAMLVGGDYVLLPALPGLPPLP